ncbi:MAG: hypothetical protein WDZ49_09485 [Litorilinea sp.]
MDALIRPTQRHPIVGERYTMEFYGTLCEFTAVEHQHIGARAFVESDKQTRIVAALECLADGELLHLFNPAIEYVTVFLCTDGYLYEQDDFVPPDIVVLDWNRCAKVSDLNWQSGVDLDVWGEVNL